MNEPTWGGIECSYRCRPPPPHRAIGTRLPDVTITADRHSSNSALASGHVLHAGRRWQ